MIACEETILDFLHGQGGFTRTQIQCLHQWWQAARWDGEELPPFLVRHQALSDQAAHLLQLLAAGDLTEIMAQALIDCGELADLRARLPNLAMLPEDRNLFATVRLLDGDDTDKEAGAGKHDFALPEQPCVGMKLGKYLLAECIGAGSSGLVFRAMHPTLQISVAVKVLHPATGGPDRQAHRKLKAEAQLLARLNHRYIVRALDFEPEADFPFLVLEYVNGPSLAELIEQGGRIRPDRVVRILSQLAEALAATHALGIVHRDIKPANVLLTRSGECKLADLGLALVQQPLAGTDLEPGPVMARAGTVLYVAPELAENGTVSEQSDLYSLGATLYHALTGSPPFVGSTIREVLLQHSSARPLSPRMLVPDLSPELANLVLRLLAKDPRRRPVSFTALLRESEVLNSR
jgi:serine/threonine-protein kinase